MYYGDHDGLFEGYWFDAPQAIIVPPTNNGGVSFSRVLSAFGQRPKLPAWRQLTGAIGAAVNDLRTAIGQVIGTDHLWGNHITVQFFAANQATKVSTGLGGAAKGYRIERADSDIRVFDAKAPNGNTERGVLWLQASGTGVVVLYVY